VRPVLIVVGFVLAQNPPQMGLVPDEGPVGEPLALAVWPRIQGLFRASLLVPGRIVGEVLVGPPPGLAPLVVPSPRLGLGYAGRSSL